MVLLDSHKNQKEKNDIIKSSIIRLKLMTGVMVFGFLVISLKLCDLGFTSAEEVLVEQVKNLQDNHVVPRADILDRNGVLLASNIKTASVYAHPRQLINVHSAAKQIAALGIGLKEIDLVKKLSSSRDFVWIKRHITPTEQQQIHDLGIPGVYFVKDERRVYLHENLFSHALGYVNIDGEGMAGIERLYNNELIALGKESKPLLSSFDLRVQNILHGEIVKAMSIHDAIGGAGIVMKAKTGEIVAMSSLPDFNPHALSSVKKESLFNQNTLGVYEWGSVFKVFTVAMGLDSNKIGINDGFDVSRPLKIGRFSIDDYKGKGGYLSVPEVFMYSSNIGVAQIAKKVGIKEQREYLQRFGLLSEISGRIPEKMKPVYPNERNWSEASLVTISYGHGVAVTGVHVVQAMSAIVNGGLLYKPRLLKQDESEQVEYKRVIKEQTSKNMRKLLYMTVQNGFARKANVDGLVVGGKTGTAEKNKNGRYNSKLNMTVFAGAFPMHDPEYVVLVMIDEPKPNIINSGYTTGGMIAAPVGGNVIKRMSQVLNMPYYQSDDQEVAAAMDLNYTPRYVAKIAKR